MEKKIKESKRFEIWGVCSRASRLQQQEPADMQAAVTLHAESRPQESLTLLGPVGKVKEALKITP